MNRRILRLFGYTISALVAGLLAILLSIAAVVGAVAALLWLTRESPATHARKAVQAMYVDQHGVRKARVDGCTEISTDEQARIYRCQIVAPTCVREHRFAVFRDTMYGADAYSAKTDVEHPCRFPSD